MIMGESIVMGVSENQQENQAQDIVHRVLAIEKEADELVAKAKAQESNIAADIQKYLKTLHRETDTRIEQELERLSAQIENRAQEEKEALEKERRETITRIGGISQETLESCASEVVLRILSR
jgi:hypothetical protein